MGTIIKNTLCTVLALTLSTNAWAQTESFANQLLQNYEKFREESLGERRIKHSDIQPLLQEYEKDPRFEITRIEKSIEGRSLNLVSLGEGDIDVLLWSQMHGDESTATMALFDIFNFFKIEGFEAEKQEILNSLRIHFLPMLNPDGAEVFERRNALGIDINRDALRLQSPEAKVLKKIRDSLDADFGFNLHDQSRYYNVEGTGNPATISFLAPAYNYEKEINEIRGNAMKLIVQMNEQLQKYIPGHVAKYDDTFEPRAFGDNIQKWGTSTVLIESGGYPGDPEKQEIRKMNFLAILTALYSIANENYKSAAISDYEKIPENDSKLFDLKLTGLEYDLLGNSYVLDLGINRGEAPSEGEEYFYRGRVADQGDLSRNYAYETVDVTGYEVVPGKIFPEVQENLKAVLQLNFSSLLKNGYSFVRVKELPQGKNYVNLPLNVVGKDFEVPEGLEAGINPNFFLRKHNDAGYALINGFLYKIGNPYPEKAIKNALILR